MGACFSAAHETTLRRPLSLSLNARDFEAVPPGRAVRTRTTATRRRRRSRRTASTPAGGIREGGTLVTVRSDYDAFIDGFDQLSRHAGDDTPLSFAGAESAARRLRARLQRRAERRHRGRSSRC